MGAVVACCVGMACCLLPGFCCGEPSRADVACWGGWGPHTPCARQIGPHPTQPTPPSRHGTLRYGSGRRQRMRTALLPLPFPHSGAGAHGIARARGEPFRQSMLAVCGGRLSPCPGAERSNVSSNQQSDATPHQPGQTSSTTARTPTRQTVRSPSGHVRRIAPAVVNMRMAGCHGRCGFSGTTPLNQRTASKRRVKKVSCLRNFQLNLSDF